MTKRIFITGGAGFIGSRLGKILADAGHNVSIYDNLHPQVHGEDANPPKRIEACTFYYGDVCDAQTLHKAILNEQPDILYHLAAETGTGQSYDCPGRYCDVNVQGTCYLIEAARQLPDTPRRIVLAGSRAVYGESAYRDAQGNLCCPEPRTSADMKAGKFDVFAPDGKKLTPVPTPESLSPRPASVYASSKLMQEHLLLQCAENTQTEPVVLRFQNVYGPGQSLNNPYTGVLSIFSSQILAGKRLNIFEDGEITRDFVYVDDVVDALVKAGLVETIPAGPINIGSGEETTIRRAAAILLSALDKPEDHFDISGDFRSGDIRYAIADISKARDVLGWTPATRLEDGLTRLAAWAREEQHNDGNGT